MAGFDDLEKLDEKGNWIIADRHANSPQRIKKALVLNLPLESFLRSAQNQGLVTFKEGELNEIIRRQIEKDFPSSTKETEK